MGKGQLRAIGHWLWNIFKPPSGVQARRVVMAYTALVVIGRFGLTRFTSPGSAAGIDVIPAWQYGVAFLALFLALYWTRDARRVTMAGSHLEIEVKDLRRTIDDQAKRLSNQQNEIALLHRLLGEAQQRINYLETETNFYKRRADELEARAIVNNRPQQG